MSRVLVLTTGGTIDAEPYDQRPVNVTPLAQSIIPEALDRLGVGQNCTVREVCRKDSKEVGEAELRDILAILRDAPERHILIVQGTDTMPHNARLFQTLLSAQDGLARHVVVFTGAMEPLSNGPHSDGWENLRVAVEKGAHYAPGVHIVMHGRRLDPARAVKIPARNGQPPMMVEA